jgi:hypothetical protein
VSIVLVVLHRGRANWSLIFLTIVPGEKDVGLCELHGQREMLA